MIGMTIHSWGAISPMVEDVEKLIRDIRTARPALQRWRETKVLVIDESESFAPPTSVTVAPSTSVTEKRREKGKRTVREC